MSSLVAQGWQRVNSVNLRTDKQSSPCERRRGIRFEGNEQSLGEGHRRSREMHAGGPDQPRACLPRRTHEVTTKPQNHQPGAPPEDQLHRSLWTNSLARRHSPGAPGRGQWPWGCQRQGRQAEECGFQARG